MIIAKLNPGITVTNQPSPFAEPVVNTYDWMTAVVQRYIPGASNYNVNLVYGNVVMNDAETPEPAIFQRVDATQVGLTAGEISTWGTNDTVLLQILATKLSLNIEDTYEIPDTFQ